MHYVIVTAVDDGQFEKKSATATITVYVQDTADEVSFSFFLFLFLFIFFKKVAILLGCIFPDILSDVLAL